MNATESHERSLASDAVALSLPQPEAETAGVLRHFVWRGDETEVSGDVSRTDAGLVVSRTEVRAITPTGITHRLLHRVPLGEILAEVRADLARHESPASTNTPLPPGRVLITDELLRRVAMAYLEETGPGKDRAVLQRLSDRFQRPKGTIRTWIKRAREEGWLGGAVQGRMGAAPGGKLLVWFAEQMNNDEALQNEARVVAAAMGANDPGAVAIAAVHAYRDPNEFEYPSRTLVAPLMLSITAQVLYGRSVGAELAARVGAGEEEHAALERIADEVRKKVSQLKQ